jgi:ATP-dependent helicase/nuclease subunit B
VPWPAARTLWLARFGRVADWIVQSELKRQNIATPFAFEEVAQGILMLPSVATTLKGRADRIDVDDAGHAIVYDYKTGPPPTGKQQKHFNKQLLLEAAMIEEGAFHAVGPRAVRAATFIGIGSTPEEKNAPLEEEPPQQVIAQLVSLFASYLKEDQGYPSRRAMDLDTAERDYDQLARVGEWDSSDDPVREVLK